MDKDKFGNELKMVMIDEVKDIEMSKGLMNKILLHRKKTLKEKINNLLDREIELPLVPMIAGFVLTLIIIGIPRDLMINENIRVVNIGSSQMIFREERLVSRND